MSSVGATFVYHLDLVGFIHIMRVGEMQLFILEVHTSHRTISR